MSTANKVIDQWERTTGKSPERSGNQYRGISPLRHDADNPTAFVLTVNSDEHGAWIDHVSGESGSLYELARRMGVDLPKVTEVGDSSRAYQSLADYASGHGVDESVFLNAGWAQVMKDDRPALAFPTNNGTRWRFIDGAKPKYINPTGYSPCWYGLERAVVKAKANDLPLVLCNGEASTVVAQHYGVPAACVTSGEKRLSDALLADLRGVWDGSVLLAYDCDKTGAKTAEDVHEQVPNSTIIDLQLSAGGDLADFCALFRDGAMLELENRFRLLQRTGDLEINSQTDLLIDFIRAKTAIQGTSVVFPFKSFHKFSGFAHVVPPGHLVGVVAPSAGGKTSFLDTVADILAMRGLHGFYYGPEWSAMEMLQRRIQRYGGASFTQFQLHRTWLEEQQRGVPERQREGRPLTAELAAASEKIASRIKLWPGETTMFKPTMYLEALLERMGRMLERRRQAGKDVTYVIWDYAQILKSEEAKSSDNKYEAAIELIKQFTMDYNIVGFVGSQVTKSATSDAMEGKNIGAHQASYITEQKFNLFVTLRIVYERDQDGNPVKTNRGKAVIAKNNVGLTGEVRLKTDFAHLTWLDETW